MTKIIKNSDCLIVIEPVLSINFVMLSFILTFFDQLFIMNPHDTKVSQNNIYKTGGSIGLELLFMNNLVKIIN